MVRELGGGVRAAALELFNLLGRAQREGDRPCNRLFDDAAEEPSGFSYNADPGKASRPNRDKDLLGGVAGYVTLQVSDEQLRPHFLGHARLPAGVLLGLGQKARDDLDGDVVDVR